MEWYAWVFLALFVVSLLILVLVLIFKSRPIVYGLSEDEKNALSKLERSKIDGELKIEQEKSAELRKIAENMKNSLDKINKWYEDVERNIDANRKLEFEAYIDNPNRLGAKLDRLLGIDGSTD